MKELQDKLAVNTDVDSATAARVKELEDADVEMQGVITEIVTKFQAGDTAGALTVAQDAQS